MIEGTVSIFRKHSKKTKVENYPPPGKQASPVSLALCIILNIIKTSPLLRDYCGMPYSALQADTGYLCLSSFPKINLYDKMYSLEGKNWA